MRQERTSAVLILAALCLPQFISAIPPEADLQLFESKVRPLFATRCVSCHGSDKSDAGLRLDSREAILQGGSKGAAAALGRNAASSRLIQTVSGKLPAPAPCRLKSAEIASLVQWINSGLPWPENSKPISSSGKNHWAFQPVQDPDIPTTKHTDWISTPVDAFVLAQLEQAQLLPSPQADRRTLIRRASYTLTGLAPTAKEVQNFVDDKNPRAYEKLVERLLESEHYGEQWARHWLDVARYSDTKGYVYAREERFWTHAWSYRDWVVDSLNKDLPYDRFLLLQVAADQANKSKQSDLAAMGFLTLGRRFLGVTHDIIDDRIDVLTRGTMGLTVACARCHDHMYDPIPTQDYYSLYSIFASSAEKQIALDDKSIGDEAFWKELHKRQDALQKKTTGSHQQSSGRARKRIADYLHAQTELEKYPAEGFDQIFSKDDLLPSFAHRWNTYLKQADLRQDPVFVPWNAYAKLSQKSFEDEAKKISLELDSKTQGEINPLVAHAFATAPTSFKEVIARYGTLFTDVDSQWKAALKKAHDEKSKLPIQLENSEAEALRLVLYGATSPCEVPDQPIIHTETYFDSSTVSALWKLQGEIDRWIVKSKLPAHFALALTDRPVPVTSRVLLRGNSLNKGDKAPRRFLSLLTGEKRQAFQHGSGRLELAQAIIDPANPLTARVMVNRVWAHHFGKGLVLTPSDFGTRADPPSHPELLDWLAASFVAEGWSLKKLHRWILLSSTFRQSSKGSDQAVIQNHALTIDPSNRLLWRMNTHRLSYEEFRDSMMASSNELDRRVGGKPSDFFKKPFPKRRALYGLVDRQFVPTTLRMFDFANPDLHIPKRIETTVPQQALFFMNHPLVLERARALATLAGKQSDPENKIRVLFQQSLQRNPTDLEIAESLALIGAIKQAPEAQIPPTAQDWQYGYGNFDEKTQRIAGFTRLPHFTGSAWQGSAKWPDAKLGWVQLTATGGHPGNDRKHAAIRRWTAPHAMTIKIKSKLTHEPNAGDGIRAFVINSRAGKLLAVKIHNQSEDLSLKSITVEKEETIDFIVDIDEVLNSDQYLWEVSLTESEGNENAVSWNSKTDFPQQTPKQLTAWEQLAQTLLCSNEFLFID
ncbi:MAG: PSD1 and planctomycete cytochrome C domain-containing protein [Verrucomicrobiota bacterium]